MKKATNYTWGPFDPQPLHFPITAVGHPIDRAKNLLALLCLLFLVSSAGTQNGSVCTNYATATAGNIGGDCCRATGINYQPKLDGTNLGIPVQPAFLGGAKPENSL